MDRKKFLKKLLLGAAGVTAGTSTLNATNNSKNTKTVKSTYDKMMKQVGFNHLPNKEITTMQSVLHKADTRGYANHGWLQSHHTFSFANYYNPERLHFGVLRVLNDDVVQGGRGFGKHPHDNMEIISIPLEGDLEHKDSMGNVATIRQGDVQVMSAGTGIFHSEYNKSPDKEVRFLQIWMFPNKKNVVPRYDQITLAEKANGSVFQQVLSPNAEDAGVWVHQNAWFHIGEMKAGTKETYQLKDPKNGVYTFVLEGEISIGEQALKKRDGYGVWDTNEISIKASKNAKVLLMDVPMQLG
ncbi:MAG: pirin family protein [Saprospiraceae bacterium]|nr:pirin family protein [Saprospiraceae bacterium]